MFKLHVCKLKCCGCSAVKTTFTSSLAFDETAIYSAKIDDDDEFELLRLIHS